MRNPPVLPEYALPCPTFYLTSEKSPALPQWQASSCVHHSNSPRACGHSWADHRLPRDSGLGEPARPVHARPWRIARTGAAQRESGARETPDARDSQARAPRRRSPRAQASHNPKTHTTPAGRFLVQVCGKGINTEKDMLVLYA